MWGLKAIFMNLRKQTFQISIKVTVNDNKLSSDTKGETVQNFCDQEMCGRFGARTTCKQVDKRDGSLPRH